MTRLEVHRQDEERGEQSTREAGTGQGNDHRTRIGLSWAWHGYLEGLKVMLKTGQRWDDGKSQRAFKPETVRIAIWLPHFRLDSV